MKLSIITINYNNKAGLQKTIDSVVRQNCKDFEWIVIDGGSTDGSRELIEHHQDFLTYWCSEPDKGIYHAMNKGVLHSKGNFCFFLNSGDVLCSVNVIMNVLPYLDDTGFLVGNIYLSSDTQKSVVKESMFTDEKVVWVLNQFNFPHQSTFIRRDILEEYGGYREDMKISSDWWLTFQALIAGNESIKYIPVDISIYDVSGISSQNRTLMYEERNRLIKERPYLYQMYMFYNDNIDIIKSLTCNRFVFFVFRLYFFLYRLMR